MNIGKARNNLMEMNVTPMLDMKSHMSYQLQEKVANFVSGDQAENKLKDGLQQAAQTVKQKLESH